MRILALIPARGGSQSIPHKNIVDLGGQPLIAYSINAAKKSKYIDRICVTSDSDKILFLSKKYGAEIIKRPAELAGHKSKMDGAMIHALDYFKNTFAYEPELIVLLQPTSPLRTSQTIDAALKSFLPLQKKYDSLIPLKLLEGKFGKIKKDLYCPLWHELGRQRQELEPIYQECGTIFIFKPSIIRRGQFYGRRVYPFIINNYKETIDIDGYDDLKLAAYYLSRK